MITYTSLGASGYLSLRYAVVLQFEESGTPKLQPYIDPVGIATIGVGFNIEQVPENLSLVLASFGIGENETGFRASIQSAIANSGNTSTLRSSLDNLMDDHAAAFGGRSTFAFQNVAEIIDVWNQIAPRYEDTLDAKLTIPTNTQERIALFSLAYNTPALIGPGLTAAISSGDRAEAFYQIRFNSNGDASPGIAKRRYIESELFGLYNPGTLTILDAAMAIRMYTKHEHQITAYETLYASQRANANADIVVIEQNSGFAISEVSSIAQELAPAVALLASAYGGFLGGFVGAWVAPDVSAGGDEVAACTVDRTGEPSSRDLIIGGVGEGEQNDTLRGGGGDDVILGQSGADLLEGGEGSDSLSGDEGGDTLVGGDGIDTLSGGAGSDYLRAEGGEEADGGDGNDTLVAESASATLTGGAGNDLLDFRGAGDEEAVVYFDVGSGQDALALSYQSFAFINLNNGRSVNKYYGDYIEGHANIGEINFGNTRLQDLKLFVTNVEFFADVHDPGGAYDNGIWYSFDVYITITATGDSLLLGRWLGEWDGTDLRIHSGVLRGRFNDQLITHNLTQQIIDTGGFTFTPPEPPGAIDGSDGPDDLSDNGGDDIISAGGGDDIIRANVIGWGGVNLFDGGSGADTLAATADDQIIQFSQLQNIEVISAGGYTGVVLQGDNAGRIIDLSGISVVGLDHVSGGGGNDTVIGTSQDDRLSGGGGQDSVSGGAGNDVIIMVLGGADSIDGGSGSDTVVATVANEAIELAYLTGVEAISSGGLAGVSIHGGQGNDLLDLSATTLTGIVSIIALDGDDSVSGSAAADTIDGANGNDTLLGGAGDDSLSGGSGSDRFEFSGSTNGFDAVDGGTGTDEIRAAAANTLIGLTSIIGVETVSSGGFSGVTISGSADGDLLDFSMVTLSGIGAIDGGLGNDTLIGSSGADTLKGAAGSDDLRGGAGNDQLHAYDPLILTPGYNDTLTGGAGNDTLNGTVNAEVYVFGLGHGSDKIVESLIASSSVTDVIRYEAGIAPSDIAVSRVGQDLWLTHVNSVDKVQVSQFFYMPALPKAIERVEFADGTVWTRDQLTLWASPQGTSGNDNLSGTDGMESILGGDGNDNITAWGGSDFADGQAGNDTLTGGDGDDTLHGSAGDDRLSPGTGNDVIDGGAGFDTLVVGYSGAVVDLAQQQITPPLGTSYFQSVIGIEHIIGAGGAEWLKGDAGANSLSGGSGNDILRGAGGADTLTGGTGADKFEYMVTTDSPVGAPDIITDFTQGTDRIQLTAIDADVNQDNGQAFTWIGTSAFSNVAGQLRYDESIAGVRNIYGDVNGDGVADFQIQVTGSTTFVASDFLL